MWHKVCLSYQAFLAFCIRISYEEVGVMTNTKAQIERRKHKRCKVQDDAFVLCKSNDTKVGSLTDITMNGLAFHYIGREGALSALAQLGILLPDNHFYLYKVPCKIISDSKLYKNHPSPISMRRCGVQFGELTQSQISQLQYFMQNYTTG
jgi:hypothetical protein